MLTKARLQAEWDVMTSSQRESLFSFVANVRPDFDLPDRLDPFKVIGTASWCEADVPGLGRFRYLSKMAGLDRSPILDDPFTSEERHLYALLLGSRIGLFMGEENPPEPVQAADPDLVDVEEAFADLWNP